ncbi:unnamed protein product [Brassica oleracea]
MVHGMETGVYASFMGPSLRSEVWWLQARLTIIVRRSVERFGFLSRHRTLKVVGERVISLVPERNILPWMETRPMCWIMVISHNRK